MSAIRLTAAASAGAYNFPDYSDKRLVVATEKTGGKASTRWPGAKMELSREETAWAEQTPSERLPLTLSAKILYGVGSVAFGINLTSLTSLLLLFFNQVIGLPAAWVGAAMMVTLMFDAVCDPLIGQWSDHTHSRWGRRHPFMYASALPLATAFYFLWNPPHGWSNQSLLVYMIALLVTVRLLQSLYEIPSHALAPELTLDYDQRTSLLSWRFFFGTLGGAAMQVIAFRVFLRKDATHPLGVMYRPGYGRYGLVAAAVMLVTILASCLGTHGFIASLVHGPRRRESWADKISEVTGTLSNRSFLALIVSGIFGAIAMGLMRSLELYINNYFWEFSPAELSYFAGIALFAAFLGVGLAPALSRRIGKKHSMIAMFAVSLISNVAPIVMRLWNLMPANRAPALLPILLGFYFVTATAGIAGFIIVASMMADVVEDAAVTTGRRSEGLLFAANGLLQKCVTGIGTFLSGVILAVIEFPAGAMQGRVDSLILRRMAVIYVPIMATCSAIAITLLLFYKIDRATHQRNVERLRNAGTAEPKGAGTQQAEAPVSRAV